MLGHARVLKGGFWTQSEAPFRFQAIFGHERSTENDGERAPGLEPSRLVLLCPFLGMETLRNFQAALLSRQVVARYLEAEEEKKAVIRKEKGEYCVHSPDNPDWSGGCYPTEGEAKKRLEQVEYFKHKKEGAAWKDKIPGGRADKKKPEDFDPKQIAKGKKVEMEHTDDPSLAEEIAMDHLTENPKYYDYLEDMESKFEK